MKGVARLLLLVAAMVTSADIKAQVIPFPPQFPSSDENSVNMMSGLLSLSQKTVGIGGEDGISDVIMFQTAAGGGPDYGDLFGHNWDYYVQLKCLTNTQTGKIYLATATLQFEGKREEFGVDGSYEMRPSCMIPTTLPSVTFSPASPSVGTSLVYDSAASLFRFTSRNGAIVEYDPEIDYRPLGRMDLTTGFATKISYPNGNRVQLYYKSGTGCYYYNGSCVPFASQRLRSVVTNRGWMLKYQYATSALEDRNPSAVTAINLAEVYCDPEADTCSATAGRPTASFQYAYNGTRVSQVTITDPAGGISRYTMALDGGSQIIAVKVPSNASDIMTFQYDSLKRVSSVTKDGRTVSYSYTDDQPPPYTTNRMVVATYPDGSTKKYEGYPDYYPTKITNGIGNTLLIEYNPSVQKISKYTHPEGNYDTYSYDTRGNVTVKTSYPKPGSNLSPISISANYDASCASPAKCNKPNWVIDPSGNETDYVYDPVTGLMTSVTSPPPAVGAVRPQIRLSYGQREAYYRNASGLVVASGLPITLAVTKSNCITQASCDGTSDEEKVDYDYGPQTAGISNNLLLRGSLERANGLSLQTCFSYDVAGNKLTETKPNANLSSCP